MGFLTRLPRANISVTGLQVKEKHTSASDAPVEPLTGSDPSHAPLPLSSTSTSTETSAVEAKSPSRSRKFSLQKLSSASRKPHDHAAHTSQKHRAAIDHHHLPTKLKGNATISVSKFRITKPVISRSEKRARASALALRSLIVGDLSGTKPQPGGSTKTSQETKFVLAKVKTDLINPSSANKVIAQLRVLPAIEGEEDSGTIIQDLKRANPKPIHAVCLERPEAEESCLNFQSKTVNGLDSAVELGGLLEGIKLVDLIKSPDFGLGKSGDEDGLLSGAIPTPDTVLNGFKRLTPELMALGYATGKAIYPDHTDWWGLEVCLPPPSMDYLTRTHSITSSVMNFLSAVALVNQGVREILPFIRYISQYIDFEFNALKAQDKGQGVVCAATWIMPAALIPRAWDFPPPPPEKTSPIAPEKHNAGEHRDAPLIPLPPQPPLSIGLPIQLGAPPVS